MTHHRTDMETRTHSPAKRGSMEEEDRLSSLPDDLLHSILRELPLKHAVRTSALSRRWAPQWLRALASSRVLDFTDPDLPRGQPPAPSAAATVRRCLELHAEHGTPLDVFRAALVSSEGGRDVVGCVASAVGRGAREVEVEVYLTEEDSDDESTAAEFVELPGDLFVARNSLARLALCGFGLRAVPTTSAGLAGLRSLSLSDADVTGEEVGGIVSGCRALEHLCLSRCSLLESIRIASETLRVLEIVRCPAVRKLRVVTAPALESLAFHGDTFVYTCVGDPDEEYGSDNDNFIARVELESIPALRDLYLSQLDFVHLKCGAETWDYANLLDWVAHAAVWTLSSDGWLEPGKLWDISLTDMTNLQELQLLMTSHSFDHLEGIAYLFKWKLPLLDSLFLRFPGDVTDARDADVAAALLGDIVDDAVKLEIDDEFVLDSLSFIKLVNFRGAMFELQLLAFILKRAPALQQLVLVTVGKEGGAPGPGDEHLEVIQRRVSAMLKPYASPQARLTVCWSSQDRSKNPVHTRIYHEEE